MPTAASEPHFLLTWMPIIAIVASGAISALGLVFSTGRTSAKIDQLETNLKGHADENKEALEKVEQRTGLRMSAIEARQTKLEDIFLTKLDANDSKLNAIGIQLARLEGFATAQREFADSKRPNKV